MWWNWSGVAKPPKTPNRPEKPMKHEARLAFISAAICFAAAARGQARIDAQPAQTWGGTVQQTIAAGGSFSYDPSTEAGSELRLEAHGGYYLFDGFLVGGTGSVQDNDAASCYELAAYCQYHVLQLVAGGNDRPGGFSPYVGAKLGLAHGKNEYDDSATGAVAGVRLGLEIFFTDNVALDVLGEVSASTGDVYPDDAEMKGSDASFRAGLTFHF